MTVLPSKSIYKEFYHIQTLYLPYDILKYYFFYMYRFFQPIELLTPPSGGVDKLYPLIYEL